MKRSLILAGALALAAGAAQARTTELVVYKGENFSGPADTIKGEVANLENGFGREVSSLIARGGTWEVCTQDHFKGRCRMVAEGEHARLGGLNNRIVSVRFLGENVVARTDVDRNGWYEAKLAREAAAREDAREERREAREAAREAAAAREAREARRDAYREERTWRDERWGDDRRQGNTYYYNSTRTR